MPRRATRAVVPCSLLVACALEFFALLFVAPSLPLPAPLSRASFDSRVPPPITLVCIGDPSAALLSELSLLRLSFGFELVIVSCSGSSVSIPAWAVRTTPLECTRGAVPTLTPAALFLSAARVARGAFLLALHPSDAFVGRLSPTFLASIAKTASSVGETRHAGVVAPLLLSPDQKTVVSAGLGAVLVSGNRPEIVLLNNGDRDGRAWNSSHPDEVFFVPLFGSVSPRRVWTESFLPPDFSDDPATSEAQLLVEAKLRGAKFFVDKSTHLALGNSKNADPEEHIRRVVDALHKHRHGERLALQHARSKLELSGMLCWDLYCGCTGVNAEAVQFLVPLERRMHVAAVAGADCFCPGYPRHVEDSLARIRSKTLFSEISFWISHKPPPNYPRFPYNGLRVVEKRPRFVIGRSMSEWAPISPAWVAQHELVDEIWVPSAWHADVWAASGIPSSKLKIVPEALDPHMYSPETVEPEVLPVDANVFKFLSVFKWEPRKGPDILLDAFFHEFSAEEPVALVLHTYRYGVWGSQQRDPAAIEELVLQAARDAGISEEAIAAHRIPRVVVHTKELAGGDMPKLYKACDAFVLPTRGEGWGLPIAEAMAMGLPTAATNWSGCTAFIDSEVAFPIEVESLEPVQGSQYASTGIEMWAKPSVRHLRAILRDIFTNRDAAKKKGLAARRKILQQFNPEAVADIVVHNLKRLLLSRVGI